ncbi:MAG: RDD family protein [Psychromonas sp.]|nr:RDD family protein [Psychromonas sp.]
MSKKNIRKKVQVSLQEQYQDCPRAYFFRRLCAYVYDAMVLIALLMLATVIALGAVVIAQKKGVLDLSAYRDTADYLSKNSIFIIYLAFIIAGFFSYFWTKAGQTIGMKAWRLRVQNSDGSNISIMQSLIRLGTSAFGLGNFLVFLQGRNAFQDLWAECEVVVLSKALNNRKGSKGMCCIDEDKSTDKD